MNKKLNKKNKISKHLNSHDSILKAITTYGCKEILTLEQGNFFYWVRFYKNKSCDLKHGFYFEKLENAIEFYNKYLSDLKFMGFNLHFNEVK